MKILPDVQVAPTVDRTVLLGLRTPLPATTVLQRGPDVWTLAELAHRLDMLQPILFAWLRWGRLWGRQVPHAARSLWLIHADAQHLAQLQAWRAAVRAEHHPVPR